MKLLITTQVRENYGAHDWDGTGECPQYWKFKGGNEYLVLNVEPSQVEETFNAVASQCKEDNDYFEEYVLSYDLVEDDYLTEFERNQLDFDGKINFPARVLEVSTC